MDHLESRPLGDYFDSSLLFYSLGPDAIYINEPKNKKNYFNISFVSLKCHCNWKDVLEIVSGSFGRLHLSMFSAVR